MPRRRPRQAPASPPASTGWRWRTFPVFFAFVCGIFATAVLLIATAGYAFWPLFVVSGAGMGYGLAHVFTHRIAGQRAQRRGERAPVATVEEEESAEAGAGAAPARRRRRRRR